MIGFCLIALLCVKGSCRFAVSLAEYLTEGDRLWEWTPECLAVLCSWKLSSVILPPTSFHGGANTLGSSVILPPIKFHSGVNTLSSSFILFLLSVFRGCFFCTECFFTDHPQTELTIVIEEGRFEFFLLMLFDSSAERVSNLLRIPSEDMLLVIHQVIEESCEGLSLN